MAFTVYRSTDTSAPTLTGETGKLNDLLDAILVNGYGSKAAAGWTKPFNTTNAVCVFQNGATGSNRYWRVRDDGPNGTSTFKEAWIRGWKVKADVNDTADASNTNPFPSAANKTNGHVIRKSAAADATARVWACYADARTCILFVYTGDTAGVAMCHYFGDYYDLLGSAGLNAHTLCRTTENSATLNVDSIGAFSTNGHYMMQSYTGAGADVLDGIFPIGFQSEAAAVGTGLLPFPNGPDGGRYLAQLGTAEGGLPSATRHYRGRLRGLWWPMSGQGTYADGDTISGTGALAGRTFNIHRSSHATGVYAVETSDTLETN